MLSSRGLTRFVGVWFVVVALFACGDNDHAKTPTGSLLISTDSLSLVAGETVTVKVTTADGTVPSELTWASSNATVATATPTTDGEAAIRGVGPGAATITATSGGLSATVAVTVGSATLVAIGVTPPAPQLAAGTSRQLTATGIYSDSTTMDVTAQVTWASATTAVATVDGAGMLAGLTAGTSTITATLGAISGTATTTITNATLVSVAVTPTTPTFAAGTTKQLTATGTFSDHTVQDLTATAAWMSDTAGHATVAASGLVTGVAKGTATITATYGAIHGMTLVTVSDAVLTSIAITPANPTVARGRTQQFVAKGTFSDHTVQDLAGSVAWASVTTATATIDSASGLAAAVAPGTSMITATSGTTVGTTTLTVTDAELVSIAVTPVATNLARGYTQQFTAMGTFSDATMTDITDSVAWTSSDQNIAKISNAADHGTATALAVGTTTITATSGAISGGTTLTVTPAVLVSIVVTPVAPSVAHGFTQQFKAMGTLSDTTMQDVTNTVLWESADETKATISNAMGSFGLATTLAVGTTTIKASSGTIADSTVLTVTPAVLVSVQVTPIDPSLAKGLTKQFVATGTLSDATTTPLTATWSASGAHATIDPATGLATAVSPGTSTVTAMSGGFIGTTTLTVTAADLLSIQVTPINPSASGNSMVQFTAMGTYTDTSVVDITAMVTWSSSDAVATIAPGGLATTNNLGAAGPTQIRATLGTIHGETTLTVTAATLVSIQVMPTNPSLPKGRTLAFTAEGTYSDTTVADITASVTWASSDTTVAQIASGGLATAKAVGPTTISATIGLVSGSTTLTVTNAVLESIAITPPDPMIATGTTQQFIATGTFSDTSTQILTTSVMWAALPTTTAQISNAGGSQGLATGIAGNVTPATITATLSGITGTTTLAVHDRNLVSIAITPTAPSVAKGLPVSFTATGTYDDASTVNLTTQVTWASTDMTVAQISNAPGSEGVATTLKAGPTTISATLGTISNTTTLTVTAATIVSIAITPANPSVAVAATQQLVATATMTDATLQVVTTTATWASIDIAVATVTSTSPRGKVTGVAVGSTSITATQGGATGTTTVTVPTIAVTSTIPSDGAPNVRTAAAIAVAFNEVPATASLVGQLASGPCTGTVQLSGDGFTTCIGFAAAAPVMMTPTVASFAPAAPLTPFATYRIRVLATIANAAGVPALADFTQATGFTVTTDGACATGLLISQVYGGGGNMGAVIQNDFIELHNAGATPASTAGLSIQYASSAGTGWAVGALPSAVVPPGGYFLIGGGSGGVVGAALPAVDATVAFDLSGTGGKVALVDGVVALAGACPVANTIDFLGYGTTANCVEGAGNTIATSATKGAVRNGGGCADVNDNDTDFAISTLTAVSPRDSGSPAQACACAANGTGKAAELDYCVLDTPAATSQQVGTATVPIYGIVYDAGLTEAAGPSARITMQIGYGAAASDPRIAPFTWFPTSFDSQVGNNDRNVGTFLAPGPAGTFSYTSRATRDGSNWTYCDLDGAGSNAGLVFDPTMLGVLTTTP